MSLSERLPFTGQREGGAIVVWALMAVLLAAALTAVAFCCYRASLPLEIDPNEAWNAWQSKSPAHLYPSADALTINNYPPLSFFILHTLAGLGAEEIYAGRALSIVASLALTLTVYRTILLMGGASAPALAGAIWFLATLAGAYAGYVGMNDPHLFGLAVMGAGFAWFVSRAKAKRTVEPAVLMMVVAGFIKHSLIALPASALIWLALERPREAARAAAFGVAASIAGLLACRLIYGDAFFEQLMAPRVVGWKNLHFAFEYAAPLLGAASLSAVWLAACRRSRVAQNMAVLLVLSFASGFVQSLGDGLDVNAYFEFLFALAAASGLMLTKLQERFCAMSGFVGVSVFTAVLLAVLALTSKAEPYLFLTSRDFRQEIAQNADVARSEAARVKKIPGDVSCSAMLICYWAGKPFVWDDFAMRQRVATRRWTEAEMKAQAKLHRIRFETIDDRATW